MILHAFNMKFIVYVQVQKIQLMTPNIGVVYRFFSFFSMDLFGFSLVISFYI